VLYRVFPFSPDGPPQPLAVPRHLQGAGRHDNPDAYTALYLAREPIAAVAERIQSFRGTFIDAGVFLRMDGSRLALASFDEGALDLIDLDDPTRLVADRLRPSQIATSVRSRTQLIAQGYFERGAVGLSWWSTLEASWTNVTLYAERVPELSPVAIDVLHPGHAVVREAATYLAIDLVETRPRRP
jgi:hypothetical protein